MGPVDLSGLDRETAQGILSARMNELTDPYTITITADDKEQAVEACRWALRAAGRPVSE